LKRSESRRGPRPNGAVEPRRFRRVLLRWYEQNRRDLPWRRSRDPYAIWVSEVMLQQTRTEVVRPRYERFIAQFPDLRHLAAAGEDDVLAAWSGLGYYGRARNLWAAARALLRDHGGVFPRDPTQAMALPGVGPYIARAILSIAYDVPLAVVDGNVARVLSRVALLSTRSRALLQKEGERLLDPVRPGEANQALMELGAILCHPGSPNCGCCPLAGLCGAHRTGRTALFPPTAAKPPVRRHATSLWIVQDRQGRIWIEKREIGPLRGLWMLPWRGGDVEADGATFIGTVTHAIMNSRYRCKLWQTRGDPERIPGAPAGPGRWVKPGLVCTLQHSSLLTKALALLERETSSLRRP